MKYKLLVLFSVAIFLVATVPLSINVAYASPTLGLYVNGKYIENTNNNIVSLRGWYQSYFVDTPSGSWMTQNGNVEWDTWDTGALNYFLDQSVAWGMNCVHLSFTSQYWIDNTEDYRSKILYFVQQAQSRGLYVIVGAGWRNTASEGQVTIPYDDPGNGYINSVSDFADMWASIANYFKSYNNVLFHLWNEPTDSLGNWAYACQTCITAIRGTGATNLIVIMYRYGIGWSQGTVYGTDWIESMGLTDPNGNLVYTNDVFRSDFVNYGGNQMYSSNEIQNALSATGLFDLTVPWLADQIGPYLVVPDLGNEYTWFQNILSILNSNSIGYSAWASPPWRTVYPSGILPGMNWGYVYDGYPNFTPNQAGVILKASLVPVGPTPTPIPPPKYLLTMNNSPGGAGTVTYYPTYPSNQIPTGTVITLIAHPATGYMLSNWTYQTPTTTGTFSGLSNPLIWGSMTSQLTITANYRAMTELYSQNFENCTVTTNVFSGMGNDVNGYPMSFNLDTNGNPSEQAFINTTLSHGGSRSLELTSGGSGTGQRVEFNLYDLQNHFSGDMTGHIMYVSAWLYFPSGWTIPHANGDTTYGWYAFGDPTQGELPGDSYLPIIENHIEWKTSVNSGAYYTYTTQYGAPAQSILGQVNNYQPPKGSWFKVEYYVYYSHTSGWVETITNGQIIANAANIDTINYAGQPLLSTIAKIYSDQSTHLWQLWVDDLEVWDATSGGSVIPPAPTPTPTPLPSSSSPPAPTPTPTPTVTPSFPIPVLNGNFIIQTVNSSFNIDWSSFNVQTLTPPANVTFTTTPTLTGQGSLNVTDQAGVFLIYPNDSGTFTIGADTANFTVYVNGVLYSTHTPYSFTAGTPFLIYWIYVASTTPLPPVVIGGGNGQQYYFRSDTYNTLGISGYGFDSDYTNTPQTITANYTYTGP